METALLKQERNATMETSSQGTDAHSFAKWKSVGIVSLTSLSNVMTETLLEGMDATKVVSLNYVETAM